MGSNPTVTARKTPEKSGVFSCFVTGFSPVMGLCDELRTAGSPPT